MDRKGSVQAGEKKALEYFDVKDVKFTCVPVKHMDQLKKRFAKGITRNQIRSVERYYYTRMSNKEAALLPPDWVLPGHIDIRKAGLRYIKDVKQRLFINAKYYRGITPKQLDHENAMRRTFYFARKVGVYNEASSYHRFQFFLNMAKRWKGVAELLKHSDTFLYWFLYRFRIIELGYNAIKSRGDSKAELLGIKHRKNFVAALVVLPYCLYGDESVTDYRYHPQLISAIVEEGSLLIKAELGIDRSKYAWTMLFGRRPKPRLVETRVANMLFGPGATTEAKFGPSTAATVSRNVHSSQRHLQGQ